MRRLGNAGAYVEKNEEERTVGKADKVTLPTTQPPAVGIATSASLLNYHGRRWSYGAIESQSSRELQDDDIKLEGKANPAELWNTALDSLEKTLPYVQQYVKERRNQKSPLVDPKLLNEFHSKVAALKSEGVKTNDSKVLRVSKHLEKLNKQVSDKSTVWLADLYDESPRRAQSLARGLNETIKVLTKVADSLTHSLAVTDIELAEQAIDKAIEEVNELDHGDTLAAMDSHTKKMRSRETSQKIPELLRVPFPKEAIKLFDEARKICNTARPVINKQAQAQADKKKQADTADRYGIATLKSAVEGTFCQQDGVEELIGLIDRLSNDKAQKWLGNTKQKHKDTFDQHLKGITHNLSLLVDIYQNPDNYQDAETWIAIRDSLDKSMTGYKKLFKKVENSWSNGPIDTLNRRYGNQATRFFSDAHYLFSEIKNVIPKNLTEKKTATSQFSHGVKNGLRSASTAANKLMQVMASTAHGLSDQVDFRGRSEAEILNASHHQRLVDSGVRALFYQLEQPAQSVSRGADRLYKLLKDLTPIKGELNLERAGALRPEGGQLEDLNLHLDGMIAEIEKNLQELTGKELDELASLDMTKLWEEKINSDKRRLLQSFKEDGEQAENDIKEVEHKWDGLARPLGERITGGGYAYNVLVPDVASKTAKAVTQLALAVVKAKKRQFDEAKVNAKTAHSIASATTADIEQRAPRGLDDYSKGSHVAKYWATKLNETLQLKLGDSIPSPGQLLTDMKKRGYLVCDPIRVGQSTLSKKDPVGLHMATQVVGELEKLRRGERVAPITQQEYVDEVAKGIVAHMVKWGQRQATGKATYFAVELAFEHGLDAVTLGLSRAIKTSVSATKAAIKIPYALHQAKKHTGVEEDWDYKALDKLLKDKLSYHAAKVGISWLPSEVKGAVGAGIWGVAELKNINTRALEATVNETHARVISGKKSKQFKTSSAEVIAFDVVVGASLTGAGKGIDRAWEARREAQLEALAEKGLNEERQPADLVMNLIANAYPNIDRGKETYKEAVDASLEKIASTSFGRDLLESMNQQQIRITMPSDNANTSDGDHDHKLSVGNYASPDNDTIFFDPQYRPSAEDVKDRPWLDCDPSIVLFHEMLHLYYSENPIQFEVSGQTYQFSGKGDPISEHMVAGAYYVNAQGVEFHFSDSKWVKQHLKMGKYVNENDLRRALNQPIRQDYYFDARNTGADQARFFNPSSSVEEESTLAHYQDNPNMAEEVKFYKNFFKMTKQLREQIKEDERALARVGSMPERTPYERGQKALKGYHAGTSLSWHQQQLSNLRDRERQFTSVVPNPERLVYAKLWRAEVREKYFNNPNLIRALEESTNAEQYLKQVEDDIENGRNARLESDLFPFRPYQTLSKFKQGTKAELDSAYASGKLRNVYIVILSKLESVKARLSEADVTQEERQHLDKQKRILEQVEVALFADHFSLLPDVRPLLEVENADELIGVTSTTSIAPSIIEPKADEYLTLVADFLPSPVNQQALEAFLESELKKAKFNHSDDIQVIEYTLAALRNGRLGIENEDVRIFGDTDYPNLVMSSDHDIDPAFLNDVLQRASEGRGTRYTADTRVQIERYSSVVLDGSVSFSDLMSPDFDLSHVSALFILDSEGNRIPSRDNSEGIFETKERIEYMRRAYQDEKLDSLYPGESQISLLSDRELIDLSVRLRSGKLHFHDFISNIEGRLNQTNLSDEEQSSLRLWLDNYRNAFNLDRESLSKALIALEHDIYDKIIWLSDGDKYSTTTIQELVSSRELRERFQSGVVNTPEKMSLSKSELDELVTLYEANLASKTEQTVPVLDAMNIGKYLSAQKDVDEAEAYDFNITVKVRVDGSQQTQTLSVPFVAAMYDIYGYLASISSEDKKYVWTGEIVDRFSPVFKQELLYIMTSVDMAEESALLHEREALASQDKSIAEMEQDMRANQQARVLDLRYTDGIIRYFEGKNAELTPSNQGPLATDLVSIQGRDDVQVPLLAVVRGNVPEPFKSQLIKPNSLDDETWQKAQNGQLYNEIKQAIEQQDRDAEQLEAFRIEQKQKISNIQGPEEFVKNWIRRNGLDPNAQITVRAKAPLQDRFKTDPSKVREYNQKLGTPHTYTIYEVVLGKASKELDDLYRLTNIRPKWPENENLARLYERQGEMLREYKDYIGNIKSRDADDMDRYLELMHQQEGGEKIDIKETLDKFIEALDQVTYTSVQRDIHFALEVVKQLVGVTDYFLPLGAIKSYVLSTGIEVGASLLQAENASSPAEKELYRLQARNTFISNTVMSVPGVLSSKPLGSVGHRIQQSYSLHGDRIRLPNPTKGKSEGSTGTNLWNLGKRYWSRLDQQFHSLSALGRGSNSGDFSVQDLNAYAQRLKTMETNTTVLESDSSNIVRGKQAFLEGRRQATSAEYRFLDEYSLKQKMDALQSNRLRNGEEFGPKTKGALYQKAKSELGEVVSERHVARAAKWAESAKSAGVDVVKILPQAKYLKLDSEGVCRPTAMLMAYAIETGNIDNFASRLENIGTQEPSLLKLLNDLHGGGSPSTRDFNELIKDMQPNGEDVGVQFKLDELSESSVFPAGCNSARIDITGEAGKGHSMSMTKDDSKYYFFEPNFGVVAFDSFDNLKSYIGNHLRSEKYGYSYFNGDVNIVQLKFADNGFTNLKLNGKTLSEVVSKPDVAGAVSQQTRVTKGGTNGFSWPKLSGRKPDSQSLKSFTTPSGDTASVVRNKVGDDFMLYTANDGVQANTLLISVHGGYHQSASLASRAPKTGDIRVPDGVTMEFLGPHGRTLSDPSIEIMNDPNFSPHSTVTSSGHTFNPHKTTGSTHMFQRDVVDASGSSDVGNIKDYRIFKYQGRHSGGAETEANIVDAIINNRRGAARATDVLTVRERTFAFSEASLSDVFQQLDLKNSQYKYVTFSGCRNELSASNPPNYSNKGGQPMWITVDVSGDTPRVVDARPITGLLQQSVDDTEASQ